MLLLPIPALASYPCHCPWNLQHTGIDHKPRERLAALVPALRAAIFSRAKLENRKTSGRMDLTVVTKVCVCVCVCVCVFTQKVFVSMNVIVLIILHQCFFSQNTF